MPTPDFVLALRAKVGHTPLWLPGVCAVVLRPLDEPKEVLLVRRMRNALLASRPATTPAPATANGRLGASSLRAELASILAWLDI